MQTLRDVVKWLEVADESEVSMKTICLRAPWNADSEARVVEVDGGQQHEHARRSSPNGTLGCCVITEWRERRSRRGKGMRTEMWNNDIIV